MINYGQYFEGQTTVEGEPLVLSAPDMVVADAELLLARGSTALEVGAGHGQNGTYLALQGHKVHSVELNPIYMENGQRIIRSLGGLAASNTYVQGDMRSLDFRAEFGAVDAVVAVRTLHLVTKPELYQVVQKIQDITKPGGLNSIKAYVASPTQQAEMPSRAFFEEDEMESLYEGAGWKVTRYPFKLSVLSYEADGPHCQSSTQMIARKPGGNEARKRELIALAQNYYRSDPEHYDDLMEEAAAL